LARRLSSSSSLRFASARSRARLDCTINAGDRLGDGGGGGAVVAGFWGRVGGHLGTR
jgi:hypothetical protein